MENTVLVGKLVAGVFATARGRYPELTDTWVRISHRLGSRLPASRLSVSIQREGEVDLVLRCIEDEMARGESNIFVGHYLGVLSAYWIGGTYETFRLLRDRKLNDDDERFSAVFKDLELIRISLEKHEIAKDYTLKEPLTTVRHPANYDDSDKYIYSRRDEKRAHIMPYGISARGSLMWQVIDLKNNDSRWVERRSLSDQIVELWKGQ